MIIALVVAAVVIIGGGLAAFYVAIRSTNPASAEPGACLLYDQASNELSRSDCAEANYRLVALADSPSQCADIRGTTVAAEGPTRVFCLIDKDIDPAITVNALVVGDCVTIVDDQARKGSCGSGSYRVLDILEDVVRASANDYTSKCTGIEGADFAYGWTLSAGTPVGTWDRILCLSAKQK